MQVFLQHRNDSGIEILEPKNSKSIGRSNSTASNKSTATLGARSTLSTLCEPSPTIEPAIVIHQADTGIVRNRPWSGVWEPLVDDDAWTATSTRDETANSPHWTPLQTWNANSSSWSARRSHQRGGGNKRPWYTRKVCLTCGAGIVLACLFVTLILIMFVHWGPRFDPTTGATGSSPQSAPGPPPPVKGILSSTVSLNTTSIYFGASIDWVCVFFNIENRRSSPLW